MTLKETILIIVSSILLNGCGALEAYRYDKGQTDGTNYCLKGKQGKNTYYSAFYKAFLLENLKKDYSNE